MRVNNRRTILVEKRVELRVLNPVEAFLGHLQKIERDTHLLHSGFQMAA
jgi:hypothetical protein